MDEIQKLTQDAYKIPFEDGYQRGQRDMLEKVRAAVDSLRPYMARDAHDPVNGERTTHVYAVYKDDVLELLRRLDELDNNKEV